jgi:hypothetical protein
MAKRHPEIGRELRRLADAGNRDTADMLAELGEEPDGK